MMILLLIITNSHNNSNNMKMTQKQFVNSVTHIFFVLVYSFIHFTPLRENITWRQSCTGRTGGHPVNVQIKHVHRNTLMETQPYGLSLKTLKMQQNVPTNFMLRALVQNEPIRLQTDDEKSLHFFLRGGRGVGLAELLDFPPESLYTNFCGINQPWSRPIGAAHRGSGTGSL